MTIPALIPSNAVEINNGRPITTSLAVAEIFEKEHFHVLRDVRTLGCSPEFTASNFWFSDYKDSTGRTLPMVQMTKDGFTILAMGYTGAKAMRFKEAYIQRFNEMEAPLRQGGPAALPPSPVGYRRVLLVLRDNGTFEAKQVPDSAVMFAPEDLPNILADSTSGVFSRSLLPAIIGVAAARLERPTYEPCSEAHQETPVETPSGRPGHRQTPSTAVHASPLAPIPPMDNAREGDDGKLSIYDQVLTKILEAKQQGISRRDVSRVCWAFRNLSSENRGKLLELMLSDESIYEIDVKSKTRTGKRLVAAKFIRQVNK